MSSGKEFQELPGPSIPNLTPEIVSTPEKSPGTKKSALS